MDAGNTVVRCCLAVLLSLASAASAQAKLKSGDVPPDLLGRDGNGEEVRISGHRGKVVVVTFWASWCGYCLKELPVLEKFQRAAGKAQLEVVAVNFKEDAAAFRRMRRHLRELELTLTHDRSGKLAEPFGVEALPFLVMVDRSGKVAYVHLGYGEESLPKLIEEINGLLAEPAPAA